jgi:hypothetical protein
LNLQEDLDQFLKHYNYTRTYQGYRVGGRASVRAFEDYPQAARKEVKKVPRLGPGPSEYLEIFNKVQSRVISLG